MMMNDRESLWENFAESGRIADYLLYSSVKNESETDLKNDNIRGNCS